MGAARQGFIQYDRSPGIDGEGGRAGTEGVALVSLKYMAKAFETAQSMLLRSDIVEFESKMNLFMEKRNTDPYYRMTI
jgi:hypothetical protein